MWLASFVVLQSALAGFPANRQQPSVPEITGWVRGGVESLARGDTAAYLVATRRAFALVPDVPFVEYHHARAHALGGSRDSALALLERLAVQGAVAVFEAPTDSAFARLVGAPGFARVADAIDRARRPISTSEVAFELPERDLIPEGTAYDPRTNTVFLSSFYKRKIVAITPDGRARDFIAPGQDGIGPVAGMEVDSRRRTIWAAAIVLRELPFPIPDTTLVDAGTLYQYDLASGKLVSRYVLRATNRIRHGFNDLTILPDGDVYVTDSQSGGVYRVRPGRPEVAPLFPPGSYLFPNGITRTEDGHRLFIAHLGGIDVVEVHTGTRTRLAAPDSLNLAGVDGLAYYRNSLIAHQPSAFQRVSRLYLDSAQRRVIRGEIIERHHPRFVQPTTGEVAGGSYYYIANAQLRRFRDGKVMAWDELDPVLVLKAQLDPAERPDSARVVAAVAEYHAGFQANDPARVRAVLGDALMMVNGNHSGDPAAWQAHLYLSGAALAAWPDNFLRQAGPYQNAYNVVHTHLRGDAAVVVSRETGRNKFRSWKDELVTYFLGREDGRWRIVGYFIRDIANPE